MLSVLCVNSLASPLLSSLQSQLITIDHNHILHYNHIGWHGLMALQRTWNQNLANVQISSVSLIFSQSLLVCHISPFL